LLEPTPSRASLAPGFESVATPANDAALQERGLPAKRPALPTQQSGIAAQIRGNRQIAMAPIMKQTQDGYHHYRQGIKNQKTRRINGVSPRSKFALD
jgi:hypothetical protein